MLLPMLIEVPVVFVMLEAALALRPAAFREAGAIAISDDLVGAEDESWEVSEAQVDVQLRINCLCKSEWLPLTRGLLSSDERPN